MPPSVDPTKVFTLNQKMRTHYGVVNNGNIMVMNFANSNGWSKDQISVIANEWSRELGGRQIMRGDVEVMVSLNTHFGGGWKGSPHLTKLGEDTVMFNPMNQYQWEEIKMQDWINDHPKGFQLVLIVRPKTGGATKDPLNDCLFYALWILTNKNLPACIKKPERLKKFFQVERDEPIDVNNPNWKKLEELLNANIFIGGDASYFSHIEKKKRFQYHLNLSNGHFSVAHAPERKKMSYTFYKEKPIYILNGYEVYDGEEVKTVKGDELDEIRNNNFTAKLDSKLGWEGTYEKYLNGTKKIKEATAKEKWPINLTKYKTMQFAMFDLFKRTTHGISEPDAISGIEGELLMQV